MISTTTAKKLALEFDQAEEALHFEKVSFKVNKKIFATLDVKLNQMVLKFTEIEQSVFSAYDNSIIYPVPNKWGKQGWTIVELKKVKQEVLKDAICRSYCNVAPKSLADKYIEE
jgi:predicted DNA-binding protein (MmcQ/YjbR family)